MDNERYISKAKIITFQREIKEWYIYNNRDFPWRKKGISKYEILIAEIMLQKTRAENILEVYNKFLKRYPDEIKLSKARLSSLKKLIKPLGLYSIRSKNFKEIGKKIVELGSIPNDRNTLMTLPGVGPYIANAFLVSAFNKKLAVVDTNIRRLYQRVFSINSNPDPRRDKKIWDITESLLPKHNYREYTWALLDFSAIVCKKRTPQCINCTLAKMCDFYRL